MRSGVLHVRLLIRIVSRAAFDSFVPCRAVRCGAVQSAGVRGRWQKAARMAGEKDRQWKDLRERESGARQAWQDHGRKHPTLPIMQSTSVSTRNASRGSASLLGRVLGDSTWQFVSDAVRCGASHVSWAKVKLMEKRWARWDGSSGEAFDWNEEARWQKAASMAGEKDRR